MMKWLALAFLVSGCEHKQAEPVYYRETVIERGDMTMTVTQTSNQPLPENPW